MSVWRRFQRLGNVPRQRYSDEVILFADSSGALKTVDEDGVVSAVAGAGSLPSPTNDGDVLTVVTGAWAGAPGGGSQPLQIIKATFGFADFTDIGSEIGRSPLLWTLEAGQQFLFGALRVTEEFDDGDGPAFYISSAASGPFGSLLGPSGTVGPGLPTASDGVVSVFDPENPAADWLSQVRAVSEVEADPLPLHVFGSAMAFDGTAGIIEATVYVATPEAA